MVKLVNIADIATIIRSKNAKPFLFTMDIFFDNLVYYEKTVKSGVINKKLIAKMYRLENEDKAEIYNFAQAWAIKITIPRTVASGGIGDTDIYGAQQHAPLYSIKIPI
ncbi:MAG: DUF4387 domain-containing protein [Candidatus Omnitrophica bacterium]|nr:DUF4387 domain-containing protein [Candidatus Omnitrophota bacterium]MBU1924044.1 DUF4387 domain-containing protein [Candidatus Omnitrophota bacterium]